MNSYPNHTGEPMKVIYAKAYAKLNLSLDVLSKRRKR